MGRHTFQGGGYLGDLMRSLMHFISRWNRTKDRLGDLKKKQRDLLDPSKGLLPPPPPPPLPPGGGNGQPPAGSGPATPSSGETAGEKPEDAAKPPAHDPDDLSGGTEHG